MARQIRPFRGPDGTNWGVEVQVPGASNAMIVFHHPGGKTARLDRYAWEIWSGPESRSVTSRVAPDKIMQSLTDESDKFYHSYWAEQQRERRNGLDLVDTLWQGKYRPRIQRFLNNTQQAQGDVLLSLPLDGEGRSLTNGKQANILTVTFPDRPNDAVQAIYVIAHEAVSGIASTAVKDNITPEQARTGIGERYQSAAAVRGGALLLQRTSPEIVDGYMRYYLNSVNRAPGVNPQATFIATFALPETIRDALTRQLDVVLGGI